MGKIRATKEFIFDCAHILSGHEGLCRNLHGHTYKVQVELERTGSSRLIMPEGDPSQTMVIDFKDIKSLCGPIFEKFDHAFVVNNNCVNREKTGPNGEQYVAEYALRQVAHDCGLKMVEFPGRATAEGMALVFFQKISDKLETHLPEVQVVQVRVWETPTSFATFTREGK